MGKEEKKNRFKGVYKTDANNKKKRKKKKTKCNQGRQLPKNILRPFYAYIIWSIKFPSFILWIFTESWLFIRK